jgi:hypothetical protein
VRESVVQAVAGVVPKTDDEAVAAKVPVAHAVQTRSEELEHGAE